MKKIIRLDASALIKSGCMLRLKRIVEQGYTTKLVPNDILYGSAFHKFVSLMYETKGNFATATWEAVKVFNQPCDIRNKFLTETHLVKTMHDYWMHYSKGDDFEVSSYDDKPMVEINFDFPIIDTDLVLITLQGTIDKFGKIKNGVYCIGDYKTHSVWSFTKNGKSFVEHEIKEYLSKFELSLQLRFYCMCIRYIVKMYPDSLFAKTIGTAPIGAFIDGVFMSAKEPTLFRRSDVFIFQEHELDELFNQVLKMAAVLSGLPDDYSIRDGIMKGACMEHKYPCMFGTVCAQSDPAVRQVILKNEFVQKEYKPLDFAK